MNTDCLIEEMHQEVIMVHALSRLMACGVPLRSESGGMLPPVKFHEPQGGTVTVQINGEGPLSARSVARIVEEINAELSK